MSAPPTFFATPAAFRAWLEAHSASASELDVGYWKVGSGRPSMTWSESVDEALCFGWIDGVRRSIDEVSYRIRFTPRKKDSNWSAINIAKVEVLTATGRMLPAGLAAFALRTEKRSGIYAYEQRRELEFGADEIRVLAQEPAALAYFEACPPGYRSQMIFWVVSAKQAQTRARRLDRLVAACAAGERVG